MLPKELQCLLVPHNIKCSCLATTGTTLYVVGQLQITRRHYPTARQFCQIKQKEVGAKNMHRRGETIRQTLFVLYRCEVHDFILEKKVLQK
jgi:hypothetical protein